MAKRRRLSLSTKRAMMGYVFVLPFIIGLITFFLYPMIQAVIFSINTITVTGEGYTLEFIGNHNYHRALFVHPNFRRHLMEAVGSMFGNVPLILIFSFFAANLLNQKFKGRTMARAMFFLPVILTSGIIIAIEQNDLLLNMMRSSQEEGGEAIGGAFAAFDLARLLLQIRIDPRFILYIIRAVDHIYEVVVASGVQILIFLAGLQSISPSLFEASNIEGATGWENFWKITFPLISPLILVNTVYSIIDAFTNSNNQVMQMIRHVAFRENNYGFSTALAYIYFGTILVVLALVVWIINKSVFYQE